eukprot:1188551-Pleurochrysis_carterae.AAC.1
MPLAQTLQRKAGRSAHRIRQQHSGGVVVLKCGCCIRGRVPTLIERAARALQPGGQADAKGVPAVARLFVGAQAVRQHNVAFGCRWQTLTVY